MEQQKGSTEWQELADAFHEIERNIERVVQGKHQEIRLALVSLVAEGHLLIEDVPGVGKTMLAKALAAIDRLLVIRRIQFTPDLLPSDVTGVNVFNQERGDFEFKPGRDLREHRARRRDQPRDARRRSPRCWRAWRSAR